MAKLIDADKLVEAIVNTPSEVAQCHTYNVLSSLAERQNEILEIIENAPEVDAVVLPCKIGQTVYRPVVFYKVGTPMFEIWQYKVAGFQIKKDGSIKIRLTDSSGSFEIPQERIGDWFYLDEGEAQKALEELKGPTGTDVES